MTINIGCVYYIDISHEMHKEEMEMLLTQDRQRLVLSHVREIYKEHEPDYVHEIDHTARVVSLSIGICHNEDGDENIVIPAALLHDMGIPIVGDRGHARYAAKNCDKILRPSGYTEEEIEEISKTIIQHSTDDQYTGDRTLAGNILFDADKLDVFGAATIYRWIFEYQRNGLLIHECLNMIESHILKFREKYGKDIFYTKTGREIGRKLIPVTEQIFMMMRDDLHRHADAYEEFGLITK